MNKVKSQFCVPSLFLFIQLSLLHYEYPSNFCKGSYFSWVTTSKNTTCYKVLDLQEILIQVLVSKITRF